MPRKLLLSSSKRYAQAVFDLAQQRNELDAWKADLDAVAEVFGDPVFLGVMDNPDVLLADKEAILKKALPQLRPFGYNFVRLLVRRGRAALATGVMREYQRLLDARRGVIRAQVTTAIALSDAEVQALAARLKGLVGDKQVQMTASVDPAIVGGLVVRIGDRLLDGSTRTRLERLRQSLAGQGA